MSLSSFSVSEPAISQVATQVATKTPPKRRTHVMPDRTLVPEAR